MDEVYAKIKKQMRDKRTLVTKDANIMEYLNNLKGFMHGTNSLLKEK